MLKLKEIDFFEFKENVYSHYIDLFPEDERKPLNMLEVLYNNGILKFVEIMDDEINVGFFIYVTIENNPYVWLDYFTIYKDYQNMKYGTKTIKLLKDFFKNHDGVYGEIEKVGYGSTEEENRIREKRVKFYINLDFDILDIDLCLFDVVYSPCVLKIKNTNVSDKDILDYGMKIYKAVIGEERYNENCFVIEKV